MLIVLDRLMLEVLKYPSCIMHVKSFILHLFSASGVRNYLKEALVTIITVHAEVKSHLSDISLVLYTQPYIYLMIFCFPSGLHCF